MTNLSDKYGTQEWFRAVIQLIPYVGGSLDTLMASQGQKWREDRARHYMEQIALNVSGLEKKFDEMILKSPEQTYDLIRSHFEYVDRTRSEHKRKRFANILVNQVQRLAGWDEPDTATRLLNSLTDSHIAILKSICTAPKCPEPFGGLRVSVIEPAGPTENSSVKFNILVEVFNEIPPQQLRLLVVELLSSGLVKDEGVGRFGAAAMEKFSPLPSGDWFLDWIERPI